MGGRQRERHIIKEREQEKGERERNRRERKRKEGGRETAVKKEIERIKKERV